jgi:hypothetical protein
MGWLHCCFLVPHFVLFFMVLAILIAMFLDNTFLPSSKQLSWLCRICPPFCACSQVMVTQTVTLKVAIHETLGCRLGAGGYGRLVMPTLLMTLHFVLFHPHGEPNWHPNITGATPAGLSSEDEQ